MLLKKCKKVFALVLAGVLAVGSAGNAPIMGQAAAVYRSGATTENGLTYTAEDFAGVSFNGTNVMEVSAGDVEALRGNIKPAEKIHLSMTFKVNSAAKTYINFLEISNSKNNSKNNTSAENIALVISKSGKIFLMTGACKGSTDWQVDSGVNIANGASHTLDMTIARNGLTFKMDNGAEKFIDSDTKNTRKFIRAFLGESVTGYSDWRERIDSVVVGGLKSGSFQEADTFQNLNGEITALTIQNGKESSAVTGGVTMETGLVYTAENFADVTFDGTNVMEISASDAEVFRGNIRTANAVHISMTFKVNSAAKPYISFLEISNSKNNSKNNTSAENIALVISKSGEVFLMTGASKGSTDWRAVSGVNIANGASHTLDMMISKSGLTFKMDNGAEKSVSADAKNTKKFIQAFLGQSVAGYSDWRERIDSIVIGGLKSGSFQEADTFQNLNGEITALTIQGVNEGPAITGSGVTAGMFESNSLDNTWLFGGGVETQGRFAEIGGVRNFIGQFEEYVRWVKRVDGVLYGMQRYTINAGKEGQDAAAFAAALPQYITRVQPKAVSYLIGPEDYQKGAEGIEAFQTALAQIVETSLAMKNNAGYCVVQLPHDVKDAQASANAALYAAAANAVLEQLEESKIERVAIVDHLSQTKNDNFKNNMLTKDGLLNAAGHLEIAKQFSQKIYGETGGFPSIGGNWTAEAAPQTYETIMPQAEADADSLRVTVPEYGQSTAWSYELTANDTTISGMASGNPFTIRELPAGSAYELVVRTADGAVQFETVAGTITKGDQGSAPALNDLQKAIRAKADDLERPLTWLFMGDSITHGAAHTQGHDGVAQLFEKYVKEDLGRKDDIVINTAVSGATTERTLPNIEQRMTKYKADIVSVMLGTNDKGNGSAFPVYKENLKLIAQKIREANPNAIVIFRTPTPATGSWKGNLGGSDGAVARMRQAAEEAGNVLFIDQYTDWHNESEAYPYLYTSGYYLGDGTVHPGVAGHLRMTTQFIEACGLNTNTKIADLSYQFQYAEESTAAVPAVSAGADSLTVSKAALQSAYSGGTIGDYTVTATDADGRRYTKNSGIDGGDVTISNLPYGRRYTVSVTANIKGSTAKHVTFGTKTVDIVSGQEKEDLQSELKNLESLIRAGAGDYTTESYEKLEAAYQAAQNAIAGGETDLVVLGGFLNELQKCVSELTVDTALAQCRQELTNAVAQYKALADAGQGSYTEDSWKNFADAYAAAERALQQQERDAAVLERLTKALLDSYGALTLVQGGTQQPETQKLAAPSIVSAKAVAEKKAAGVKITVQKVANAETYTVYRTTAGKTTEIGQTNAAGVVYDLNPVSKKTSAYYAVADSAKTEYTRSENGPAKTVTLPAAVKKVKAKQVKGKTQVRVSWKKVKGASRYVIYRSEQKNSGYVRIKTVKKGKTVSFIDKKVKKGKKYYYRVVVKTKKGFSGPKTSKVVKMKK